ncbi:MAG TPA: hypothetical protein VH814_07230 [Steroidobacteraceae bacterium]
MNTSTARTVLLATSLAFAALTGAPANAELPEHPAVAGFGPTAIDFVEPDLDVQFGDAVAIRDGIAFAGLPDSHGGRVAVFTQTSGWQRVQTLDAPVPGDQFGRTLAFRDGLLIVGGRSAVDVYKRSNGVWIHVQTLQPLATDAVELFPLALRYEGGTLLATADRGSLPSLVYVFELNTNGRFFRRTRLRPLAPAPGEVFGASLSMTSTTLLIGAPHGDPRKSFNIPDYSGIGAAYVFKRNSRGNWAQTQKLTAVENAFGFGAAVAIDRGMIIVGAPKIDVQGGINGPEANAAGGAAYGFLPVGGRYLESFKLRPRADELPQYEAFGFQIAMSGRFIAIAAAEPYGSIDAFPRGFVLTYERDGNSVTPRGVASGHLVSSSLGLANNLLLVGDPGDDRCISGCPGRATLYDIARFRQ